MVFIDTNVFVYAHDESDPEKTRQARDLITNLASSKQVAISTQVIAEFSNVVLKQSVRPLLAFDLRRIVRELFTPFMLLRPDADFYVRTLQTYERYSLRFYDAAIVQAANDLGCNVLYSEDLQVNAKYGNVTVVNPFHLNALN